jgi:hypothetical protein
MAEACTRLHVLRIDFKNMWGFASLPPYVPMAWCWSTRTRTAQGDHLLDEDGSKQVRNVGKFQRDCTMQRSLSHLYTCSRENLRSHPFTVRPRKIKISAVVQCGDFRFILSTGIAFSSWAASAGCSPVYCAPGQWLRGYWRRIIHPLWFWQKYE